MHSADGTTRGLTRAQAELQAEARSFAMDEVLPVANAHDHLRGEIPRELVDRLARLGYFGITISKQYGGLGLGVLEYCLVIEELSRAWLSVATLITHGNGLVGESALPEDRRAGYLSRMAVGDLVVAFALSEADAGSDAASIQCAAERRPGCWALNGNKKWCGYALEADAILVFARTQVPGPNEPRHSGISAFLVEKPRGEWPVGVTGEPIDKIGHFGDITWTLTFTDCQVPDDALVGAEGTAFREVMAFLDEGRAQTAARAVGLARGALEDAIGYAARREQFGRRIGEFQAIAFMLADMASEVEAARRLTHHTARMVDSGEALPGEASMCKLFASEMAERVTSNALQIYGGEGYTTRHAIQRYWRDARLLKLVEGTSEIQRRIISKALMTHTSTSRARG